MARPSRMLASITAIAAIASGAFLITPTTAVGQEAPNSDQSVELTCNVSRFYPHGLDSDCWHNGWKVGVLIWHGELSKNGKEYLAVGDKRHDGRRVTAHAVWYDRLGRHHKWLSHELGYSGTYGDAIDIAVPEGAKVYLKLCLEGVGCGPKYSSTS